MMPSAKSQTQGVGVAVSVRRYAAQRALNAKHCLTDAGNKDDREAKMAFSVTTETRQRRYG